VESAPSATPHPIEIDEAGPPRRLGSRLLDAGGTPRRRRSRSALAIFERAAGADTRTSRRLAAGGPGILMGDPVRAEALARRARDHGGGPRGARAEEPRIDAETMTALEAIRRGALRNLDGPPGAGGNMPRRRRSSSGRSPSPRSALPPATRPGGLPERLGWRTSTGGGTPRRAGYGGPNRSSRR